MDKIYKTIKNDFIKTFNKLIDKNYNDIAYCETYIENDIELFSMCIENIKNTKHDNFETQIDFLNTSFKLFDFISDNHNKFICNIYIPCDNDDCYIIAYWEYKNKLYIYRGQSYNGYNLYKTIYLNEFKTMNELCKYIIDKIIM